MNAQEQPENNTRQTNTIEITKDKDGLRPAHHPPSTVTRPSSGINGKILNVLWKLKKTGKAEPAIRSYSKPEKADARFIWRACL